jgi:hypothetical protein
MEHETLERRIRRRAYELWRQEGSMEGCADEYWRQAREMIEAQILEETKGLPTDPSAQ